MDRNAARRSIHARLTGTYVASSVINGNTEYYTQEDLIYVISQRRLRPEIVWPIITLVPSFSNSLSVLYNAPGGVCVDRWHTDVVITDSQRRRMMDCMFTEIENDWNATRVQNNDSIIADNENFLLQREISPPGFTRVTRRRRNNDIDSLSYSHSSPDSDSNFETRGNSGVNFETLVDGSDTNHTIPDIFAKNPILDYAGKKLFNSKGKSAFEKICEGISTVEEIFRKEIGPSNPLSPGIQKLSYDIERCMITVYRLFKAQSPQDVAFELFAFAHEKFGESITVSLHQIYCALFDRPEKAGITAETKADDIENHSDFLKLIRDTSMTWERIRRNKLFDKIHFLISCAVTLQLCKASDLSWSINGVQLYKAQSLPRAKDVTDIVSSVIDCVLFFVEGGAKCFEAKSITPLFFHGGRLEAFESDLLFLQTHIEDIQTGNFERRTGKVDNDYAEKLYYAENAIETLYIMADSNAEKQVLGRYRKDIKNLIVTYQTIKMNAGLRIRPFATLLFGDTCIGKSTLTTMLTRLFFQSIGMDYSEDIVGVVDEADAFMSNWKTHYKAAILDDVGNTKENFLTTSPLARFLHMVNMVPMSAPQPEAHLKGKVSFDAIYVGLTSNIKDIRAGAMSHKPNSILSRLEVVITPKVADAFRTKGSHTLDVQLATDWNIGKSDDEKMLPPFWTLTAERAVLSKGADGNDHHTWQVLKDENGKPIQDVSVMDFVKWYVPYCRKYYNKQKVLLETNKDLNKNMSWCSECKLPKITCLCDNNTDKTGEVVPESIMRVIKHIDDNVDYVTRIVCTSIADKVRQSLTNSFMPFVENSAKNTATVAITALNWAWKSPFANLTTWLPQSWLYKKDGSPRSIVFEWLGLMNPTYNRHENMIISLGGLSSVAFAVNTVINGYRFSKGERRSLPVMLASASIFGFISSITAMRCYNYRANLASKIAKERGMLSATVRRVRDNHVAYMLKKLGWVFGAYVALKTVKTLVSIYYRDVDEESLLSPVNIDEVRQREAMPNQWLREHVTRIPGGDIATATTEQVIEAIKRNIVYVRYQCSSGKDIITGGTTGLFICSNYLLMTNHTFVATDGTNYNDIFIEMVTAEADNPSSIKRCMISFTGSIQIGNNDARLFYVHNSGDKRNILKWFPINAPTQCVTTLVHRNNDGRIIQQVGSKVNDTKYHTYNDGREFYGCEIIGNGNLDTEKGMCGSPWVSSTRCPCIAGIHCGSKKIGMSTSAYALMILREELVKAKALLEKLPFNLRHYDPGVQPDSLYGKPIIISSDIHKRSFLNWIEGPISYTVLGTSNTEDGATLKSKVETTPISPIVEEIFGYKNVYGPPLMKPSWKPFFMNMESFATPSYGFPGKIVDMAVDDLYEQWKPMFCSDIAKIRCKPLTIIEATSGIDGYKIMERINVQTSPGLPFSGSKEPLLEEAPETVGITKPIQPCKMVRDECDRILDCYKRGVKYHPVFKACIKDEAKVQPAKKARMFMASPIAFTLMMRKYFLPVFHIMALNPTVSEQAIGINCASPEWEELMSHVEQHGKDRMVAGDYKSYDHKISSQLTRASFALYIRCAELTGNYSEEDIRMMHGLASDATTPIVCVNGTVIQLVDSVGSGTFCTGQIDGTSNSLMLRITYFAQGNPKPFRKYVAATTFGDDNRASVSDKVKWSFSAHKLFLENYGIIYTDPTKSDMIVEYLPADETDFLKRKSVFIPELNLSVGALEIESIIKPFHCWLKKPGDEKTHYAQLINSALFEYFLHGRKVYEDARSKLNRLAIAIGTATPKLNDSFDDRVKIWEEDYSEYISNSIIEDPPAEA